MYIVMGYDADENLAFRVAMRSLLASTHQDPHVVVPLSQVSEEALALGFNRPYRKTGRQYIDMRDGRPFSTEFSFARFMVPHMKFPDHVKWVMWCDGDVMFRGDPKQLLQGLDDSKALYCVKHGANITGSSGSKMGGLLQEPYSRKNWSSVMIWNVKHNAHKALTVKEINHRSGRDLHNLFWLENNQIGELDCSWNFIPGLHTSYDTKYVHLVHFSLGVPTYDECMAGEYSAEWFDHAAKTSMSPDDALWLLGQMAKASPPPEPVTVAGREPMDLRMPVTNEVPCTPDADAYPATAEVMVVGEGRSKTYFKKHHACDSRCIEKGCDWAIQQDWEADNIPF